MSSRRLQSIISSCDSMLSSDSTSVATPVKVRPSSATVFMSSSASAVAGGRSMMIQKKMEEIERQRIEMERQQQELQRQQEQLERGDITEEEDFVARVKFCYQTLTRISDENEPTVKIDIVSSTISKRMSGYMIKAYNRDGRIETLPLIMKAYEQQRGLILNPAIGLSASLLSLFSCAYESKPFISSGAIPLTITEGCSDRTTRSKVLVSQTLDSGSSRRYYSVYSNFHFERTDYPEYCVHFYKWFKEKGESHHPRSSFVHYLLEEHETMRPHQSFIETSLNKKLVSERLIDRIEKMVDEYYTTGYYDMRELEGIERCMSKLM